MKSIAHLVLSVCLALFFIYAGSKKFIPKERKADPAGKIALVNAVQQEQYENPIPFKLAVKMMSASGFLKLVGVLQILSGLLILFPKTRLGGLIFLLPITLNVFCIHLFMDNRADENIETGILFGLNLLLLLAYRKKLGSLLNAKIN
jgi:putative oxidoreductase